MIQVAKNYASSGGKKLCKNYAENSLSFAGSEKRFLNDSFLHIIFVHNRPPPINLRNTSLERVVPRFGISVRYRSVFSRYFPNRYRTEGKLGVSPRTSFNLAGEVNENKTLPAYRTTLRPFFCLASTTLKSMVDDGIIALLSQLSGK
jgi:hypothetical protein